MKNKLMLCALVGYMLVAVAQQGERAGTVTVPAPQREKVAPVPAYKMSPLEFKGYDLDYKLSNGMILYLSTGFRKKMFAQVNNQTRHEIIATSPGTFVALDGKLFLNLKLDSSGNASGDLKFVDEEAHNTAGEPVPDKWLHMAVR
jgi:hypothetical protein